MSKIERFEDLIAWRKARALACSIYRISETRPFSRDFALRNQIRKAAVSVPSNIAEGFERFGLGELAYFLSVAKASCGEVRSHLYLAFDVGHIDEQTMRALLGEATSCAQVIGRLRAAVETTNGNRRSRRTQDAARRTPPPCS